MAQTGYTPIKLYASSTPSAAPSAANLDNTNGAELAINIADGKLFFKDSSGNVQVIAGGGITIPQVIDVNSSSAALRITQTGAGNALVVEDSANPDSTPFVVDAAGNVGIGTGSPVYALTVSRASSTQIQISAGNTSDSVLLFGDTDSATIGRITYAHADDSMRFLVNTSERMRIDSAGNVAIGTTAASTGLRLLRTPVSSTDYFNNSIASFESNTSDGLAVVRTDTTTIGFKVNTSRNLVFGIEAASGGFTERMRITSAGNVGIGTTSPLSKLTVTDSSSGASTTGLVISNPNNGAVNTATRLHFDVANTLLRGSYIECINTAGANNPTALVFATNAANTTPTERMRIDSNGNLGLGITPSAWSGVPGKAIETYSAAITAPAGGGFNTTSYLTNAFYNGTNWVYRGSSSASRYDQFGTQHIWYNAVTGTAGNTISWAQLMTLDASGRLLFGTTTARSNFAGNTTTPLLQIEGATAGSAAASIVRDQAGNSGAVFNFGKTRGAAVGDNTVVVSGDQLGIINFQGADGTNLLAAASIQGAVDGTPGANDMPGRLVFSTTDDGASTPTERMRIDSSGRLLVGTTSSRGAYLGTQGVLQVEGTTAVGSAVSFARNSADTNAAVLSFIKSRGTTNGSVTAVVSGDRLGFISFDGTDGTNPIRAASIVAEVDGTPGTNDMPGRLVFSTTADGASSPTERMRIDSAGNLGLGVTPSAWGSGKAFEVGTVGFGLSSGYGFGLNLSSNAYYNSGYKYAGSVPAANYTQANGVHSWYTAPSGTAGNAITFTQAMTLDASGNLLVGTTSTSVANDGLVFGQGANGYLSIVNSSATSGSELLYLRRNGLAGSGNYVEFQYGASLVGSISCTSTATTYATSSDYRLKENVQPMQDALAKVAALKPCTYTWKADGSGGEGFIAHELAEVVPQCVIGEKDAVDDDGNPVYQGIDTSFLVATLTAAIQEQQTMIEELKAKVAALEAR